MDEVKPLAAVPTVEHREPYESRGSRTVLGARGGEIPPRDSTIATLLECRPNGRFSNRPVGVKHFQTVHHCSVDVARGLALLFGIGTRALVWGFLCQGILQGGICRFLCSTSKPVSSFRSRASLTSMRAEAVKVGRRTNLAACFSLARSYLDCFEHDGTLNAVVMTIRGEPAFGRGSIAPQPCIRWVQGPEP